MRVRPITDRQREILEFVRGYIMLNGYSPTLDEIANRFGFRENAAKDHLLALEKKKAIRRAHGVGRSIVILEAQA